MAKAPDDLNKYIDFSNHNGMDNQDSTVKNYADELLANAIKNNPLETAEYFGNPNNQQSVISDGVFARALDSLGSDADLSEDSLQALRAVAQKDPLATLNLPAVDPKVSDAMADITDSAFTDAAKYYSPSELSEKLSRFPEGKLGLIPQMLEKSIADHPLRTAREIEDFQANLNGLKHKFPALADALDSLDIKHNPSECKDQQVSPNSEAATTSKIVAPELPQDPLAATGLKWKYKPDGTAVLDIADIANSTEKVQKMLDRMNRNSISNFSTISDSETRRFEIIITPEGVKDLYGKGDKTMQEVGDSIKGEKTVTPNSSVETIHSYLEKNFPGRGDEMVARLQSSAVEGLAQKTATNPVAEL